MNYLSDAQRMANLINGFAKLENYPGEARLQQLADECLRSGALSSLALRQGESPMMVSGPQPRLSTSTPGLHPL